MLLTGNWDLNDKRTLLYFVSFGCMGLAVGVIGPLLPGLKAAAGGGAGVHSFVISRSAIM